MERLLRPAASRTRAVAEVHAFLGSRWRRWRVARLLLPAVAREDLTPLLAWFELVRLCDEHDGAERTSLATRLRGELTDLEANEARSALGGLLHESLLRFGISTLSLRGPLAAVEELERRHVFASRSELVELARRLAGPEARALLSVLRVDDDRSRLQGEALALGLQLSSWIARLPLDLRRGRLLVPLEDLTSFGLGFDDLEHGHGDPRARRLVGHQIDRARAELAKGWPLCSTLGPYRGRLLAFVLRWHAAALSAIEARGDEAFPAPPRAGWPRLFACGAASVRTRTAPF